MQIEIGQTLPKISLHLATKDGPTPITTQELFQGKLTVLFGLPGAFTPTCNNKHFPGFVQNKQALLDSGIQQVVCVSVNDAFVMHAWGEHLHVHDSVVMLSDGSAKFTSAVGLGVDLSDFGLGYRSKRYVMIVDDMVVTHLFIEDDVTQCEQTSATFVLDVIKK